MKLLTKATPVGGWVKVDASLPPTDIAKHQLIIGDISVPTGVDQGMIVARCPEIRPGRHRVITDGVQVGTLEVVGAIVTNDR